MTFAARAVAGE